MSLESFVVRIGIVTLASVGCGDGESAAKDGVPPLRTETPHVSASASSEVADIAGARVMENRAPREGTWTVAAIPIVSIGDGITPDNQLHLVSDALMMPNGALVIASRGTSDIRWYDSQGTLVRRVGQEGDGPGEYRWLAHLFQPTDDTVTVVDTRLRRMAVYDSAGVLARTVSFRDAAPLLSPWARFEDGSYLLGPSGFVGNDEGATRVERIPFALYRLDEESGLVELLDEVPGWEVVIAWSGGIPYPDGSLPIMKTPRPFGRTTYIAANAQGWVVGDNERPEIQHRTSDGELVQIVRWTHEAVPVTSQDVAADLEWAIERQNSPVWQDRLREAREKWPPPPEIMPVFGELVLDSSGNVWVEVYAPEYARTASSRWMVFDSAGEWRADVALPPGVRLLWASEDAIVALNRDDYGVERVSVHTVLRN